MLMKFKFSLSKSKEIESEKLFIKIIRTVLDNQKLFLPYYLDIFLLSNILIHVNKEQTSEEINKLIVSMTHSDLKSKNENLLANININEEVQRLKNIQNKLHNKFLSEFLLKFD
jgi:hypothetical protein